MQRIGFVVYPGYSVMSLAVGSVFELANQLGSQPAYSLEFLSEAGGPVRTSAGLVIETKPFGLAELDTLIIGGGTDSAPASPELAVALKDRAGRFRRIAAICTGAFLLAEAGLLDGRRVTTHWAYARELQRRYPTIKVEEDRIFVNDGSIWTSAGMSAGVDLALALVEEDLGPELTRRIARKLVVYHRRGGGQSQFSALLELEPKSDRIQRALDHARKNLRSRLSVGELAAAASLSPRQFSRAFLAETGQSPAKAVEHLRLEAARLMMEQSRHPTDYVAEQTGFSDRHRMRQAFLRAFNQPPQVIRRNARQVAA